MATVVNTPKSTMAMAMAPPMTAHMNASQLLSNILGTVGIGIAGVGFGAAGGASGGGGQAQQPSGGGFTLDSTELLALANLIPLAQDGQIITSDHHNSIRTALLALIGALGGAPSSAVATISIAPTLLPDASAEANWQVSVGVASKPSSDATHIAGWVPIDLPHQAHIHSMQVLGSRSGTVQSIGFDLVRQPFTATTLATLISIVGDGTTTNPFGKDTPFETTNLTPAAIEDSTRVDNSKYKYMIRAMMRSPDANANVQILAFQVNCTA